MNNLFSSVFDTATTVTSTTDAGNFFLCIAVALVLGLVIAAACGYNSGVSKSFKMTLAMLPAIVAVVIMMVNGNVGAGVAVAGAFSLVRFRSVPGSAKDIAAIFLTMAIGLILGMGYIGYAAIFTVIMCVVFVVLNNSGFGTEQANEVDKNLRITIPEDLNYTDAFDDLFEKYTVKSELVNVKTTNMGSLFKLNYHLTLKNKSLEKEFIDALRVRNGNLEITMARKEAANDEL